MISVPNRLPLLSGNRLLGVVLIPLLLISCGAFKKTAKVEWPEDDVIVVNPEKDSTAGKYDTKTQDEVDAKEVKEEKTLVYSSVYFKGENFNVPQHKQNFDIAILLPFHSDAANSSTDTRRSDLMLEYYQGVRIAIPEIERLASSFKIHFYDTDNDTAKLKLILNNPEMEKMDLIIGPTDDAQVRIAAYFARKREIPLFSPITTTDKLWSNNPYVFNLNPSDQMQAMQFLKWFKKAHKGEKLIIVRDGKHFDKGFGKALVDECVAQKINFSSVAFSKYLRWNDYLSEGKNVVVTTSQDKTNMNYTVTGLLNKANRVTLVGPEDWLSFTSVDFNQLERLKVTYISTNKANVPNKFSTHVMQDYRLNYKDDPSWYTYMGHDQILFACEVLDAFGKYFPLFIEGKSIPYANTNIELTKTATCFQNKYIQLFELRDMELRAISIN